MMRSLFLLAFGLAAGGPAQAFDCLAARGPIESAICASSEAKVADAAMVSAFEQVRSAADPAQRKSLLDDQRAWLKQRNIACQSEKIAGCLIEANGKRTAMLLARAEAGPGIEPPPIPFFVRQAGNRTKVDVGVQVYRFAEPRNDGERLVNTEADKTVAGITWKKDEPDDRDWSEETSWTLAYASPSFVSVRVTTWSYSGGAHGSSGTGGLNIDMRSGRVLGFTDLFDSKAETEIGKTCFDQIAAEKKQRESEIPDAAELRKQIDAVAKDLANWTFGESSATVHFDPYAVGSYAEGPYECEVPMKQLSALSRRLLPLR